MRISSNPFWFLCVLACAGLLSTLPAVLSEQDDCRVCKDVLQVTLAFFLSRLSVISHSKQFASDALLLGNTTIDELDKHLLDFAVKTGLCGAKGRIGTVDVCEGALNEYGKLVAQIIDQSPIRTLAETDLCALLRFCPLSPQSDAHPAQRRAPLLPLSASHDRPKLFATTTSESSIGHFTIISDIHWDPFYSVGSVTDCDHPMCCRANYAPRLSAGLALPAGKWGDYACDPPWIIVNATLAFASSLPADFVLFTGDGPPHDVWNQSASYNMDTIDTLMALLKIHFPSTPIFPSVGNHDTFPCDQFSINQTDIYSSIASIWSRFLPPPALHTVAQGAFYSTLVTPGLRAIALNSMWGDPIDFWVSLGNVTNTYEREFVETELQNARENKEKVLLLGHIPIGVVDTDATHIVAMQNWTRW
jgi:sphingomyelin phosphodiesterase